LIFAKGAARCLEERGKEEEESRLGVFRRRWTIAREACLSYKLLKGRENIY